LIPTTFTSVQLDTLFGASSNQYSAFFTSSTNLGVQLVTPIVLDLNGDGIQTTTLQQGVSFDVNNNGTVERTAWVARGDGLLVRDLNKDGLINDGGELFGEGTVLADGTRAADGYVALRALDSNLDGVIDAKDTAFGSLKLWVDNGNGITDQGELKSLAAAGITSISLDAQSSTSVNNGNLIGLMGSYTTADGSTHTMGDVWFSVDASGQRTFDLAKLADHAGTVDLSSTHGGRLSVTMNDVLQFGEADVISGSSALTITGNAGDTVVIDGAGGWNLAGTTQDAGETYQVYVNHNAHLLVNDKLHTVIV